MKKIFISRPKLSKEASKLVSNAINTSWISSIGKNVSLFEKNFKKISGKKYNSTCSSGFAALHLALIALNIKKGDEVIVPSLSFIATANAVHHTGAKVIFADVNEEDWTINISDVKKKITKKTKAIIPVHIYGFPCDMFNLKKICLKKNIYLIEDVAEAHGTTVGNKLLGSFGDISCYSFYANKIMTTGEGGMCCSDNKKIINKINILKDHGISKKKTYYSVYPGFNYRMTNLQASIGIEQLKNFKNLLKEKKNIYEKYLENLREEIENKKIIIQKSKIQNLNLSIWLFSIRLNVGSDMIKKLKKNLIKNNIEFRPLFYPMEKFDYFGYKKNNKISSLISNSSISLPTGYFLKNREINFICKIIKNSIK
tara:strand:- start:2189 stop:3295 length:1107 start_codon:yes stop_codon:yes gene_type:complete